MWPLPGPARGRFPATIAPDLIVCGEPTSALDVSVQSSVLNLLSDLQNESGLACIFISHDLNVINYVSDGIMVMYLGRICEYGRREEVVGPPLPPLHRGAAVGGAGGGSLPGEGQHPPGGLPPQPHPEDHGLPLRRALPPQDRGNLRHRPPRRG